MSTPKSTSRRPYLSFPLQRVSSCRIAFALLGIFLVSSIYYPTQFQWFPNGYRIVQAQHEYSIEELSQQTIVKSDNGAELARLCSGGNRAWNPNIILECPQFQGGFGNIRMNLLACLRYAIEARVSMKLSTLSRRNDDDVSDYITSNYVGFDYIINEQHFLHQLRTHCPGLHVYDSEYRDPTLRQLGDVQPISDLQLGSDLLPGLPALLAMITTPNQWPVALDKWIVEKTRGNPPSDASPVIFSIRDIAFSWPTSYDSPAFVRQFSSLVQPPDDVRFLAASALDTMRKTFDAHVDFPRPGRAAVHRNPFIGIHLRVEKDASDSQWMSYENQASYITQRFQESKYSTTDLPNTDRAIIYVASGDLDGIARLASDIAPNTVVTKNDLLPEGTFEGTMLRNMTWDQQALVDLLILEHSGYFLGSRDSSFSWNIALRRAAGLNWIVGGYPERCWLDRFRQTQRAGCKDMLAHNEEWRDNLSALIGDNRKSIGAHFARVIWP